MIVNSINKDYHLTTALREAIRSRSQIEAVRDKFPGPSAQVAAWSQMLKEISPGAETDSFLIQIDEVYDKNYFGCLK